MKRRTATPTPLTTLVVHATADAMVGPVAYSCPWGFGVVEQAQQPRQADMFTNETDHYWRHKNVEALLSADGLYDQMTLGQAWASRGALVLPPFRDFGPDPIWTSLPMLLDLRRSLRAPRVEIMSTPWQDRGIFYDLLTAARLNGGRDA